MKDRKKKLATGIGIFLLLIMIIGASYAYFIAQIGSGASVNVTVETDTVDSLQFTTGGAIGIKLNQTNFASGEGNQKGSTTATATLIAGTNRTPSYTYNVYLLINKNELFYTTSDKKPELILKLTNPSNTAVTSIAGLTYNSTLGGFDITESTGLITLASNYTITTTSTLRQNWKVEVEAINLDSDQSALGGKSFNAELVIQKNELNPFAMYIKSLYTAQGENGLYLHDSSLTNSAEDGSYRYSGDNYVLTAKASAYSNVNDTSSTAKGVIKMYCSRGSTYSYVDNIDCSSTYSKYFYLAYDTKTEPTQYNNYFDAAEQAVADGYLEPYIKNYVCFGSDEETCPDENLYRIIGAFGNQVKLIKSDYTTSDMLGTDGDYSAETFELGNYSTYKGKLEVANRYHWNYKNNTSINGGYGSNNWRTSLLNKTNLNTNYINYLNNQDPKWANMIADTIWNLYGSDDAYVTVKNFYKVEKLSKSDNPAKIGLMYVSDYGYAASPSNWNINLTSYGISSSWMYMGYPEFTIAYVSGSGSYYYIYGMFIQGELQCFYGYSNYTVRPVFYLKNTVGYISGDGTKTNPYRIA